MTPSCLHLPLFNIFFTTLFKIPQSSSTSAAQLLEFLDLHLGEYHHILSLITRQLIEPMTLQNEQRYKYTSR